MEILSLAIDAVILFSAVLIIWLGVRRGFVRSVMGMVTGIVSTVAAYAYTPVLAEHIRGYDIIANITDSIAETLRSLALNTETDLYDLERLALDLPEPFTSILERYGMKLEPFTEQLRGLTGCDGSVVDAFAAQIAAPTANVLSSVAAFVILFFVILLALSLVTALLDLIFNLPVLRSANLLAGFILGVVEAWFFASLISAILYVFASTLGAVEPAMFGQGVVNDTIICKFFMRHNILDRMIFALGWGSIGG